MQFLPSRAELTSWPRASSDNTHTWDRVVFARKTATALFGVPRRCRPAGSVDCGFRAVDSHAATEPPRRPPPDRSINDTIRSDRETRRARPPISDRIRFHVARVKTTEELCWWCLPFLGRALHCRPHHPLQSPLGVERSAKARTIVAIATIQPQGRHHAGKRRRQQSAHALHPGWRPAKP